MVHHATSAFAARVEPAGPLSLTSNSPSSTKTSDSFAQQLATAVEGHDTQAKSKASVDEKVSEAGGRNSGGSQFIVKATREGLASPARPPATATTTSTTTTTGSTNGTIPTMLGMGPVAGTPPVKQVTTSQPVASAAPISEADAYWNAQPPAVQALRDMPYGDAKEKAALNLANQGYSIDTQIMVWGWDPQMTMTVRENQGYSWVPSYGQSNIPIGPGLSMPGDSNTYNPGNPPPGAIQVSTAFAAGTIQNPLVQTDSSST